jgi:hypothetical protein
VLVRIVAFTLTALAVASSAWTQSAQIAVGAGLSAGTGSVAPATDLSASYLTAHRIGFEVALSLVPDLDFGTIRPQSTLVLPPEFPDLHASSSVAGRATLFQVNVIAPLMSKGKLHLSGVAGGGTASLRTSSHLHMDGYTIHGFPEFGLRDIVVPPVDRTISATSTGLALSAGGIADYDVTRHVSLGVDVRYSHAMTSRALNIVRTAARLGWHF